jgi:orotidine-5'-phosphate decarboxylase
VVETGLQSGVHASTFDNAYGFVRHIGLLPADMQSELLVSTATSNAEGDDSGYYTTVDVSHLCSKGDVERFVQRVRQRAEQRTVEYVFNDAAQANIVAAFIQLLFAIIVSFTLADKATDFAQWTWDKMRAVLRCVGLKASDADRVACPRVAAAGKPVYMVVARFIIYASTVGAAVFSFVTSTNRGVGLSLVDGYPAMATQLLQYLPCAMGRSGERAVGYVESATVYIEQQTWAVALVCGIAFGIVLIRATLEVVLLMKAKKSDTKPAEPTLGANHEEDA